MFSSHSDGMTNTSALQSTRPMSVEAKRPHRRIREYRGCLQQPTIGGVGDIPVQIELERNVPQLRKRVDEQVRTLVRRQRPDEGDPQRASAMTPRHPQLRAAEPRSQEVRRTSSSANLARPRKAG